MRILISNIVMSGRTGTEIVTRDFAAGLTRRGHAVEVFTDGARGPLVAELARWGIPVVSDPACLTPPDVIHLNHLEHGEPVLERFPGIPAVLQCHDPTHANARSRSHSSIRAWCAVSDACRARVAVETGLAEDAVSLLPNYVDLTADPGLRRRDGRGKRWLFVAEKEGSEKFGRLIALLSLMRGASLRRVGPFARKSTDDLTGMAAGFDVVWASARCALESAVTGAAVVVCDPRGVAGFLSRSNWQAWRDHNLGFGCLASPPSLAALSRALADVDAEEAYEAAVAVRRERDLETGLDRLEDLYRSVMRQ